MTRILNLGVAQLGPIARDESRSSAVRRMIELMEQAHQKQVELIVFPELALTTFFPRWYLEDPDELEAFFETEMPNQATQPLFDAAARMGIGLFRDRDAQSSDSAAVRRCCTNGHRVLLRLCRIMCGKWTAPPVQHKHLSRW